MSQVSTLEQRLQRAQRRAMDAETAVSRLSERVREKAGLQAQAQRAVNQLAKRMQDSDEFTEGQDHEIVRLVHLAIDIKDGATSERRLFTEEQDALNESLDTERNHNRLLTDQRDTAVQVANRLEKWYAHRGAIIKEQSRDMRALRIRIAELEAEAVDTRSLQDSVTDLVQRNAELARRIRSQREAISNLNHHRVATLSRDKDLLEVRLQTAEENYLEASDREVAAHAEVAELKAGTQHQPYTDRINALRTALAVSKEYITVALNRDRQGATPPPPPPEHPLTPDESRGF